MKHTNTPTPQDQITALKIRAQKIESKPQAMQASKGNPCWEHVTLRSSDTSETLGNTVLSPQRLWRCIDD